MPVLPPIVKVPALTLAKSSGVGTSSVEGLSSSELSSLGFSGAVETSSYSTVFPSIVNLVRALPFSISA